MLAAALLLLPGARRHDSFRAGVAAAFAAAALCEYMQWGELHPL